MIVINNNCITGLRVHCSIVCNHSFVAPPTYGKTNAVVKECAVLRRQQLTHLVFTVSPDCIIFSSAGLNLMLFCTITHCPGL